MSYKRSSLRNQKAKLAADYNELLKELSSREMTSIGCYTIGDTIGEGTFGKVKIGTHKLTGQQVAVKKISKQHASMIAREIHHHRQLHHSNIVRIYEIIVTESSIHIFSEYCPNGELFDLLAATGRFSESRTQLWMQQLTSALQLCHSQGIVHRDLKLENILLDIDNNCKICDFGFARFADNKQLLETFCGSLAYSAPEVIMRQKYTGPETDIWSLGVILYTLLAGELPFDDDSEITTQRKIVNVDYQMPHYFSPYAQDLIANLLKRDPADRLTMDQIINHPWMQHNFEDNTSTSSNSASELDIHNNPTTSTSTSTNGSTSISSSDDDDDEVEDDLDSDGCSSSTRYSSRSDLDSIFSNPRFKNDLMEEDEDDMMTEASFSSFNSDPFGGKSGDLTHHQQHQQQQHYRKYHNGAVPGSTNYTDGSKFSPQVRFSLGILRPEEKVKYSSRSPRFSAPTVSNRSMTSSQPPATFRSSLPLSLSSNRESIRPSSVSSIASVDSPMNPTEQRLAATLVAAGFDEYIVHSMRSNTCGTANTLWNMLMEKQQHDEPYTPLSSVKTWDASDRWSTSSPSIRKQNIPLANTQMASVDSSCQTISPPTATRVDRMTQTDTSVVALDLDKSTAVDTSKMTISPRRPSLASSHRSYSSFTNPVHNKPSHQSISSVASLSSMSSAATSEKSGWLTSVKSWFGGSANKQEGGIYDTPLRPSQLRRHIQQQQQQQQQLASYRDFDPHHSPHLQSSNIDSQDELAPPIYRSGTLKYRRHMLQLDDRNQQSKTTGIDQSNHHRQTVQHPGMESMLAPPPPTATTTPRPTADNLTIITTPKYVSSTAVPSHVTEVDICEKRNPMYHRPLPPPAPPAPIYTNSSKNSNNRLCYQNQYLPPPKKQPSPPHDVEPISTPRNRATPTNSRSPAPLTPSKAYPTPSSSAPISTAAATPSSPVQLDIHPVLPATPPTTEDEGKEKVFTHTKKDVTMDHPQSALKATALPDLDMQILKPHSSKSSPTLLPSSIRQPKGTPSGPPRRFEFAPRSRLSVYGMNERGSMANKAIIEEEEEEE